MAIIAEGTLTKGRDIGRQLPGNTFIWRICPVCRKGKWVRFVNGKPTSTTCRGCSRPVGTWHPSPETKARMSASHKTPAERFKNSFGYIIVRLSPYDPFYPMANKTGYVREHRLVVAKRLGRCLLPKEHVHHKDGIKDHNEDSNLELISPANHALYKTMCVDCELRKEVRLLRWQIKELTSALQEKLRV